MPFPERLGKYLIRREIGRGAMGVVYEGYDPLIERTVAVKVLRTDDLSATQATELRQRFRREAQAAGRLSHPNIVSVYEYGEEPGSGQPFIAMEFVRGSDLKALLDGGTRLTLAEIGRLMSELLAGLQHAHAQGVVHRDIKPGNIIVLDDGHVKVGDFGIAKLDSSELTQVGSVLGTVSHMSPEQLAGQPVDARSDLFSCGVVLYQLLTGKAPFSGSPATVVHQVLYGVPAPPSSLVSTLPPALDAVVERALAKQPGQRYASAEAFATALRTALDEAAGADATVVLPQRPAAPSRELRRPVAWRLGAAVLLAAAGGGGLWWLATRDAGEAPRVAAASAASSPAASAPATEPPTTVAAAASPAAAALPAPPPVSAMPDTRQIEQQAWEDALRADSVAAYEAYLRGYPQGHYAVRARVRLAALAPKEPARPVAQQAPRPAPPEPAKPTPKDAASEAPKPASRVAAAPATPPPASGVTGGRTAVPAPAPRPETRASAPEPDCSDAVRREQVPCQVLLGDRYRRGQGVPRDLAEAAKWYRKAAERGDAKSQWELSRLLESGEGGVGKDLAAAVGWTRKAADQGHAGAQNRLGNVYEDGEVGPPNLTLAADWYRKAAEQGLPVAQNNLGRMYLRGRGVFKDTEVALQWLRRAAEQGEPNAKFHLAGMYERGDGVPRDSEQAMRLYREALGSPTLAARNRQVAQARLAGKP
jgi:TPR repeat protein/tRNA A-37 threonylcarbamoyl transferase component Bud32